MTDVAPMDLDKNGLVKHQNLDLSMGIIGRAGGAYIPPAKLRAMQAAITDKSSAEYQRMSWEALKKSINGLINKVNTSNIKHIVPELFAENLIRGHGLFCRSIMKAQSAALPFTHVYAALVAIVNTKFPQIGELLISRMISQFRRAYKRSDKILCLSLSKFLAHLVNHRVAHEIVALQLLTLLLERPTDDSVEVAVGFMRECGAFLADISPKASNAIFERFRSILHEGQIDKRTQYMVEVLYQVRRDKFSENPTIIDDLDLVEEEDQITHYISLDDDLETHDALNVFKFDPEFLDNEEKYQAIKREILGDDSDDSNDEEGSEEESDEEESPVDNVDTQRKLQIIDETNTNLINLRRGIYLTIMSSLNFEECAHKLMKLNIEEQHQIELCNMIIECCSQERTYVNFYGLLGERFARINPIWAQCFAQCFEETYKTVHRFETNRLRNIAKYFAHLLASDAITWEVFALVRLTEQDTTSSSRIFLKILFQELVEALGLKKLNIRLHDPEMIITVQTEEGPQVRGIFDGLFPLDNPRNTRFSINYFTSIGLGGLTDRMREYLKNAPKMTIQEESSSDESSDSDSSSGSDSEGSSSDSSGSDSDSSSSSSNRSSPVRRQASPSPPRRRISPARRQRSPSTPRKKDDVRDSTANGTERDQFGRSIPRGRSVSRSKSPDSRSKSSSRSPSPVKRRPANTRSPMSKRRTSRSPRRRRERSKSPIHRRRRSPSSSSESDRSRSPRKKSLTGRRSNVRSRSPVRRRSRSRSQNRVRRRSRSHSRSPRRHYRRRDSRSRSRGRRDDYRRRRRDDSRNSSREKRVRRH